MEIYSSDVKLTGDSQFIKDWNTVAELFQKWKENDSEENWNHYFEAKYRLEQGMSI